MQAGCTEQGVAASLQDTRPECMMASNILLSYGGCAPATAVRGMNPRELSEFDADATPTAEDDYLERSSRLRLIAKACILKKRG